MHVTILLYIPTMCVMSCMAMSKRREESWVRNPLRVSWTRGWSPGETKAWLKWVSSCCTRRLATE